MDFVTKANESSVTLYTSELAIYEAIPILLQESYCGYLQKQGIKSFRRIQRKILKGKIPISLHQALAPKIESIRHEFEMIDFDDLPPETHENAQKIAVSSTYSSFDALHIAIAMYLSEYAGLGKNGKRVVTPCYIITNDVSHFSQAKFKAEIREFTKNLIPACPKDALSRMPAH